MESFQLEMKMKNIAYQDGEILIGQFDEDVEVLKSMLTNFGDYEAEFEQLSITKRKREYLAARLLLNKVFGHEVMVCYDKNNKPYLQSASEHISISHSKNYVAVMVHPTHAAGIDLELRTNKVRHVYKRFLNPAEQQYLYDEKTVVIWNCLVGERSPVQTNWQKYLTSQRIEIFPFQLND